MGYLSAVDATFLQLESPRTPMHVGGLMVFSLPEDAPQDYLRKLFEKIRSAPVTTYPFNCRIQPGTLLNPLPSWEKVDNIDIDYHVRHSALPYPGGERELGVLVARLHSHPIDMTRPLWEFHLIEGLENRRFAMYLKAHHSAIDGLGAMRLIKKWLSDNPNAQTTPAPWSTQRKERKEAQIEKENIFKRYSAAVKNQATATGELVQVLRKLIDPVQNPEGGIRSSLHTPKSLFNLSISAQRRLATQLYDVERFKKISAKTGATINDISLAIIGSAARRYLSEMNALPDNSLIASIPVGVARPDGTPGNAVAGFVCPLLTDQEDPIARLSTIRNITSRTKEQMKGLSRPAVDQFALLGMSPLILGQMTGLSSKIPPFFNMVVSNVVASKKRLYIEDAELEAMYPISLLFDGYALNVTIVGYADRISMGFIGCRNAVPSLQRLAVYTGEALQQLEEALGIETPD
ncbi:MAG TPA: wax ester/triacylglycerol synthase family O-acyltransferase [Pseudomonadales bacterium]|nr:wax ester/triacylglycerol synthase family O-acyltransferase [Pseudomonadales bacterium]